MNLQREFLKKIQTKLTHGSITDAGKWASHYRIMDGSFAGPWSFKNHPWLKALHTSTAGRNVCQKGAQLGVSEAMLNIAFYQMDMQGRDVLYLLPNTRPDAYDFSSSRFSKILDLCPHVKGMFTEVNNVGHKRSGSTNLYVRGANSRSGLKSMPANVLIFDEFDEMDPAKVTLAEERTSGQLYTLDWKISTPTVPNFGINKEFNLSTQEFFYFPCPSCSQHICLKFPDNMLITGEDPEDPSILETHLICDLCKAKLPHEDKITYLNLGDWQPTYKNRLTRGFQINQLYSPTLPPYKIAQLYLRSRSDPISELEFFNSKLGLARLIAGAQISDEMFDNLVKAYQMTLGARRTDFVTLGADIGRSIHVHIDRWEIPGNSLDINSIAKPTSLWIGEVKNFEELDALMHAYFVRFAVVDAMPETREATRFAMRFYGRVRLCRYNSHLAARSLSIAGDDISVQAQRTSWMDQALGRYRNGTITLPSNLPRDYKAHLKAPSRTPVRDRDGNVNYRYLTADGTPDHYAHARVYSEIALPLACGFGENEDISEEMT